MGYQLTVGLEIHAELSTETKLFCACANRFGGEENTRTCPVCMGFPGALPVLNRKAVELAVKAGLCLHGEIQLYSAFDRKNYFYPDLPKAYQITQFYHPICKGGYVEAAGRRIGIERIHIEEDAGKLTHDPEAGVSRADYNRCGVPLVEIVTRPEIHTPEEARDFVAAVARRLRYAGVCDGRMEEGSLRCDVNLSVCRPGEPLGVRTEMKNLSSLRTVRRAVEAEYRRQVELLAAGGQVVQETRRFDEKTGLTHSLRDKAEAADYRYFPEPDLPPLRLTREEVGAMERALPEMPESRQKRYLALGLPGEDAALLTDDRALSDFYDQVTACYPAYKAAASLIRVELLRCIKEEGQGMARLPKPEAMARLTEMQETGRISKGSARQILGQMYRTGEEPEDIARREGLYLACDNGATDGVIQEVLAAHPVAVAQYLSGEEKVLGFFVGQAMRRLGKAADPALVRRKIAERLAEK